MTWADNSLWRVDLLPWQHRLLSFLRVCSYGEPQKMNFSRCQFLLYQNQPLHPHYFQHQLEHEEKHGPHPPAPEWPPLVELPAAGNPAQWDGLGRRGRGRGRGLIWNINNFREFKLCQKYCHTITEKIYFQIYIFFLAEKDFRVARAGAAQWFQCHGIPWLGHFLLSDFHFAKFFFGKSYNNN